MFKSLALTALVGVAAAQAGTDMSAASTNEACTADIKKFCEAAVKDDSGADGDDVTTCGLSGAEGLLCAELNGAAIAVKIADDASLKGDLRLGVDENLTKAQKAHADRMESVGLTSTTGAAVLAGSAAFALVAAMLQ